MKTPCDCEALEIEAEALRWELAGQLARHDQVYELGRTVERRLRCEFGELLYAALEARFLAEIRREEREAVAAAIDSGEDWDYGELRGELERRVRPKCLEAHSAKCRLERDLESYPAYLSRTVLPAYDGGSLEQLRRVIYLLHVYANPERSPSAAARDRYRRAKFEWTCERGSPPGGAEVKALAFAAEAETSPEWSLPEHLPELAAELRRRIGEVREEIDRLLGIPPFDQLHLLEDPEAMEAHRASLRAAAANYRAEGEREKALLDELMGR